MYGFHTLLGRDYELAKKVKVGNHRLVSAHEFKLIDGKTALVEAPTPIVVSLKPWGGRDQEWIVSGGFQELDIETGEVLFEWQSLDHVDPKKSAFPLDFGPGLPGSGRNETDAWNYFHINSVDKDDEGNYLISARNVAAVFKINGTTGDIIWQLGGYQGGSDFALAGEDIFAFQHHARFRGRSADGATERISLFDNGAHSAPVNKTHPASRARVYELNHRTATARAVGTYEAPDGLSAPTQGSVQLLENGNVFVNWGQAGAVTEYSRDGKVLFHSYLDSAPNRLAQSYRGWRLPWTGTPAEEPAVTARRSGGKLDVHVSWNGDTETSTWRFYIQTAEEGSRRALGEVKRVGFETHGSFHVGSVDGRQFISADAIGADGAVLRQSKAILVKKGADSQHFDPTRLQWPLVEEL
ncbi:hypothetical protein CCM_06619 [Cordyceps militaris CM01]|uniref:Arylsulfotransferase n=1 Tax=Cordyceps militaris (strain CM01) TaxID=983644 RepID=G3JN18_CORMM|nr:uncharacterized protein CCM_06619 [Cordyceps militaris CM01]EGX90200.1 hypothetical protein CCM_06619 [Cordyceps militaris CM01]